MNFLRDLFNPPPPRVGGYVYTDPVVLAVNVALATGRPLLVSGPPGSGKSTLARGIARVKEWRYLQQVVTSRTQADDLLAGFDALRRLNDAQIPGRELLSDAAYVEPGLLWWAFDSGSARRRGAPAEGPPVPPAADPSEGEGADAVVLLDEIDKADPDVPNDLLEALDRGSFRTRYRAEPVRAQGQVLVVLTTNGERDLPPAFLRRCAFLALTPPDAAGLAQVARVHFGRQRTAAFYRELGEWFVTVRDAARRAGIREPGTAEYLDVVRACIALDEKPGTEAWEEVARVAVWKHDGPLPESGRDG